MGKLISSQDSGVSAAVETHYLSYSIWKPKVLWGRRSSGRSLLCRLTAYGM